MKICRKLEVLLYANSSIYTLLWRQLAVPFWRLLAETLLIGSLPLCKQK